MLPHLTRAVHDKVELKNSIGIVTDTEVTRVDGGFHDVISVDLVRLYGKWLKCRNLIS